MNKKFQIFISSTFRDLEEERQDTIKSILDMEHIPSGMEALPAADMEQFEYIKKIIDECDYYILIIGARYGSVDTEGISFTEREHDYARSNGKVVLSFLHDETDKIAVGKVDTDPVLAAKLEEFRTKVKQGKLVKHWNGKSSLQHAIVLSLTKAFSMFPAVGWVRGNIAASDDLLRQINDLRNENDVLIEKLKQDRFSKLPAINNLAQLNHLYTLNYTYTTRTNSVNRTHKASVELTWEEIFKAIGIQLSKPSIGSIIESSLKQYINQKISADHNRKFSDMEVATIKFQLIAMGLIFAQISKATDGKQYEFLSLTPEAKIKLFDLMAVRAPEPE